MRRREDVRMPSKNDNRGKTYYCSGCRNQHSGFKEVKRTEGKKGMYHPYRDSMRGEVYTYTEVILGCCVCGKEKKIEKDKRYRMSESRFETYGRHSHYGT